jgi:hypothetical protein
VALLGRARLRGSPAHRPVGGFFLRSSTTYMECAPKSRPWSIREESTARPVARHTRAGRREWSRSLRRVFRGGPCWDQSRRTGPSAARRLRRRNRFGDARRRPPFRPYPVSHPQPLDVRVLWRRLGPPSRPHQQVEHQHQATWEDEGHAEGSGLAPPSSANSGTACIACRPHLHVFRPIEEGKSYATDSE